jgi:hypothetical protein
MRFSRSSSLKWFIGALGFLMLMGSSAFAQSAGKFTLDKEVIWGDLALTPGEYAYSLEHHGSSVLLLHGLDGGPSFMVLAKSISTTSEDADKLVLQRANEQWVVSDFIIGTIGETLSFSTSSPKLVARKSQSPDKLASLSKP